jgi:hypothetical protein
METDSQPGRLLILPPAQFNFAAHWERILPLFDKSEMLENDVICLQADFVDCMQELRDDGEMDDKELDRLVGEAKAGYRDYRWLRHQFEACDLANVMQTIAEEIYPDEEWIIIENVDHTVVTNPLRTRVFDLKNFDEISGAESLIYAGDTALNPDRVNQNKLTAMLEDRVGALRASIDLMKANLDQHLDED